MKTTAQDFLRIWAEQLLREHRRICWQHQTPLQTPVIEIGEASGYWGKWWPARQTIVISARLIRQHPWEIVLNVFRHEMAHQLVSETHGPTPAHGDLFLKACERLGVPPEYRRAGGALPEHLPLPDPTGQDRTRALLEKVRKLLALSESANEHEALLALRKARELIDLHGLPQAGEPSVYCSLVISLKSRQIAGHHRAIAALLIDHFQVEVVLATTYDAAAGADYRCLDIIGRPGQVKVAEYLFHFLTNRLEMLWEKQRQLRPGAGRTGKNSYRLGLLKGFREKLAGAKKELNSGEKPGPNSNAANLPVRRNDPERDRFLAGRYPKLRSSRGRSVSIDPEQYRAGQEAGRNLELRAGLNRPDLSPTQALPGEETKRIIQR